ncbi:AAEL010029-PA, partial [Aedes aegypti]
VDIDEELLNKWQHSVRPLFVDYIQRRPTPLTVEVWRGSISSAHECLKDTDVVVGIEIIEHLHADVLEGVPENVFGFIRPKVAMFSTPNSEYNVMFDGLLENGFRHDDHKFEWTRAQFAEWCDDILRRYPDYLVKYFGIGPPPKDHPEDIGYVSQLAVFVRKDFIDELEALNIGQAGEREAGASSHEYKLLYSVEYPVQEPDNRDRSEKLLDEAEYQIRRLKFIDEDFYNYEENQYQIPLQLIADCMVQQTPALEELRLVLTSASYRISEQNMVLVTGEDDSVGSEDDFEYDLRDDDDQAVGDGEDRWAGGEQP